MAWQTLPCFITPNIKAEINSHTDYTMQLCSAEFRVGPGLTGASIQGCHWWCGLSSVR